MASQTDYDRGLKDRGLPKIKPQLFPELELAKRGMLADLKKEFGDQEVYRRMPDGSSWNGPAWQAELKYREIAYRVGWERTLEVLGNIEGGAAGVVGFAFGGPEGSDIGANIDQAASIVTPHPLNTQGVVNAPPLRDLVHGAPTHQRVLPPVETPTTLVIPPQTSASTSPIRPEEKKLNRSTDQADRKIDNKLSAPKQTEKPQPKPLEALKPIQPAIGGSIEFPLAVKKPEPKAIQKPPPKAVEPTQVAKPVTVRTIETAPEVEKSQPEAVTAKPTESAEAKARATTSVQKGTSAVGAKGMPAAKSQSKGSPQQSQIAGGAAPAKKPGNQKPRAVPGIPAGKPELVSPNVQLTGETANTGGIKRIRASRGPDGALAFKIEGDLKKPLDRSSPKTPNFNKALPSAASIGLPSYEIAHLWGPGFGDEAFDGLMYAPREVNQIFQNQKIEARLREWQDLAQRQNATIKLDAVAESHPLNTKPGHMLLKEAEYNIRVRLADGTTLPLARVHISVPPPGSKDLVKITAEGGLAF